MYQLVPSDTNRIQLLEGSIPKAAPVAVVVELSCIKYPALAAILTDTLATFLIVNSHPAPIVEALGIVMVCDAVDPVKIIYLAVDVAVPVALIVITEPPGFCHVAKPFASEVNTFPVPLEAIGKVSPPVNVETPVTESVDENVAAAPLRFPVSVNEVPVAAPIFGVINVGVLAKTKVPVPVSSAIAFNKLALVGVAKKLAIPVPKPLTPVAIGNPVALVKVAALGVPKFGVTKVGDVANTKLPVPVDVVVPVPPCATSIVVALHTPEVIVPTLVKLDPVTVDFKVVPDKVPASATILAVPAAVNLPLLSTVNVGIAVVEP